MIFAIAAIWKINQLNTQVAVLKKTDIKEMVEVAINRKETAEIDEGEEEREKRNHPPSQLNEISNRDIHRDFRFF